MKIPEHLQHLERDSHGRPVPWVNLRGPADIPERWTIRYDKAAQGVAAHYDEEEGGAPDFTKQCIQRQRAAMVYGLCQVCARPLDWSARHLVISSVSVEEIDLMGMRVPVVEEPWLCPDDAWFATRVCPELIRRRNAKDLTVVEVKGPDECQLVMSWGWIEGPYELSTKQQNVAMWAKILLSNTAIQRR